MTTKNSQTDKTIEPSYITGKELSLVVPVYNEEDSMSDLFTFLNKLLEAIPDVEILLVNDGSTDGTREKLDASLPAPWKVIHSPMNCGYGATLKKGIKAATGDWIVICDADGTYPYDRIPELYYLARKDDLDMVVGARTGTNVHIPLIRRPAKWVLRMLANYISGHEIPDLNSGLRIMRKQETVRFFNILPSGFSFTTTITLSMLTNSLAVVFVPIDYYRRDGASKIHPIKDTLNFVQLICRTVLYFNPLRIFVPLFFFFFIAAFASVGVSYYHFGQIADVTFGVLLMTSVQILAMGLLADMIDKRLH